MKCLFYSLYLKCLLILPLCESVLMFLMCFPLSKLTQDNRMESPIPMLPLPTPDVETDRLIKMKDEEVNCYVIMGNITYTG